MPKRPTGYCPVCSGRLEDVAIRLNPDLDPRQRIRCLDCRTQFELLISPPDSRNPSVWTVALSAVGFTRWTI